MTIPAHGNLLESSAKQPDVGFEASGLSPEEADRLAASFRPSWELDEAPFTQGNGLGAAQVDSLAAGGGNGAVDEVNGHADSRTVPPHAPPARVETHEPEVSVIIDRSITAAEMERSAPAPAWPPAPAPVQSPFAAPFPPAVVQQRVAPVLHPPRMSADESLEIPASLKKSNKGLFIGLGVAVAAAALVFFVVHGALSSDEAPTAGTATTATATATENAQRSAIPPIPPPPPATAATIAPPTPALAPALPAPTPAVQPARAAAALAPLPRPQPRPVAPPHRAAPRPAPKAPGGGIVRDVPF